MEVSIATTGMCKPQDSHEEAKMRQELAMPFLTVAGIIPCK